MHQITIRLLLGIVITVSQYKTQTSTDCGGLRRISPDVNNCQLHENTIKQSCIFESASTHTRILFLIA